MTERPLLYPPTHRAKAPASPGSPHHSWSTSRAAPLRLDHYPPGHPAHVTIRTHRRQHPFASPPLARVVFRILRSHERTLAAVLMPDHLHWILDCAEKTPRAVAEFKSLSTHLAWKRGRHGRLWQRSYFDHVLRNGESLEATVRYVLANPLRARLTDRVDGYPWTYDRFGLAGAGG